MKFFLFSLLLIALFLPFSIALPSSKIVKESITSNGKNRSYYPFVPEKTFLSGPQPLILMLHGSGRNGLSLVEKWKELASKEGIILVGPDSLNSDVWAMPADGPDFLHELVESLRSKYPINGRRMYLFGHSAGAGFAIYMSLLESKYFAATAIHAGALSEREYRLIDFAERKIPIAIFVGTNDAFFPLPVVRATRDVLNGRGFSVELTEISRHNHNYYVRASEINRLAWEFLRKHELSEEPQYKKYQHND